MISTINECMLFSQNSVSDMCELNLLLFFFYSVCLRWYYITRCQILWKCVDIHAMELTSYQVQKLLPTLPSCVSYIRICCMYCPRKQPNPIITAENASKLKEHCPHLETLIIENAFLATYKTITDIAVENLPQQLCVLSLRRSIFRTHYFFTNADASVNIKVLDFTSCICIQNNHLTYFSRLRHLEELYLAGCQICDFGIRCLCNKNNQTIPNLKVLDLEATKVGDQSISALKEEFQSLEKLYLQRTNITDEALSIFDRYSLKNLNTLCLMNNSLSSAGLKSLLKLKSLKNVYVAISDISKNCLLEIHPSLRRKLRFKEELTADTIYCDHFMKRNCHYDY